MKTKCGSSMNKEKVLNFEDKVPSNIKSDT